MTGHTVFGERWKLYIPPALNVSMYSTLIDLGRFAVQVASAVPVTIEKILTLCPQKRELSTGDS